MLESVYAMSRGGELIPIQLDIHLDKDSCVDGSEGFTRFKFCWCSANSQDSVHDIVEQLCSEYNLASTYAEKIKQAIHSQLDIAASETNLVTRASTTERLEMIRYLALCTWSCRFYFYVFHAAAVLIQG